MELLIEFIYEIILEGLMKCTKSKRIPKAIRYILLVLIGAFYACILGLLVYAAIISGNLLVRSILSAVVLLITVVLFRVFREAIK